MKIGYSYDVSEMLLSTMIRKYGDSGYKCDDLMGDMGWMICYEYRVLNTGYDTVYGKDPFVWGVLP